MTDKTPQNKAENPMNNPAERPKTTVTKRDSGIQNKALPTVDALKARFKEGSIPLESDFSDLIDLAAAPQIVPGTIIMFYGSKIPDGWVLCDGTGNKTPDLRGKFIKGGESVSDNKGGGSETTSYTPSGTIKVHDKILNVDQIPPHNHYINYQYTNGSDTSYYPNMTAGSRRITAETEHMSKTGGGIGHDHLADFTGIPASISIDPPYYTLCFIMKI